MTALCIRCGAEADPKHGAGTMCFRCVVDAVKAKTAQTSKPSTLDQGDSPCHCDDESSWYWLSGSRFLDDHVDRACIGHDDVAVIYRGKKVAVRMRPCDARELMSDAESYASSSPAEWAMDDAIGLISSARSVVGWLLAQGVDRRHPGWPIAGLKIPSRVPTAPKDS